MYRSDLIDGFLYGAATMDKLNPFQVVFDEVIESRCCNLQPNTVCKSDCHPPPPDKNCGLSIRVDVRE
jgi:hypothetical protein